MEESNIAAASSTPAQPSNSLASLTLRRTHPIRALRGDGPEPRLALMAHIPPLKHLDLQSPELLIRHGGGRGQPLQHPQLHPIHKRPQPRNQP
eukprot:CAMPEP_0184713868 /NCGR_PEP_ID=MMETSP0314-20130426/4143_1 /TAXON_ID=38298 /ORGANISM="Rhodella maculata, Strain CCMP 736" /LENGTH=92 /DNA_ID=CAMNT_0027176633 /DNA_START=606 /DNA_END=880 /DNA_ORIENTATION=-